MYNRNVLLDKRSEHLQRRSDWDHLAANSAVKQCVCVCVGGGGGAHPGY